ncbi:major facilitator transporter [mine drainage metagenome]|uniref:Major facilitator transporter n=1 Tax=mine drainage metagenome TaxID=410659 RepID=T1BL25_9ZZZZ
MITKHAPDAESIDKSFKFLIYSRAFRSVGIIYMTLAMPLYLAVLGVSLLDIGFVVAGVMLFMVVETLLLGSFGDRYGYRRALRMAEILPAAGAFLIFYSTNIYVIIAAIVIAGIGGTAGGMRGGFSPGMTALVAINHPEEHVRVRKYGLLNAVGAGASIFGALLISLHGYLSTYIGALDAFRYIFLLAGILMLASFVSLMFLKEAEHPRKTTKMMKRSSLKYISKIIMVNSFAGIGIGIALPLLPLWLELMYHASTLDIGIIFGASYILTSLGSYLSSRISYGHDALNISSITRILNGVLLMAMALSPFILIAGIIYSLRSFNAGFGSPNRSAITMRGIDREDFGTASSIQGVSTRASQLSSAVSGYLMDISLPIPMEIGGAFQLASGVLYKYVLKGTKPSE